MLLGGFAERYLQGLSAAELDEYERILDMPEPELFDLVSGRAEPAAEMRGSVMNRLLSFKDRKRTGKK